MISKELLSEVLGESIETVMVNDNDDYDNDVYYSDYETDDFIDCGYTNIYELAHKCKEWALVQGIYNVISGISFDKYVDNSLKNGENGRSLKYLYHSGVQKERGHLHISFEADTEPEAIFQACEWIMKQKEIR